jgi:hypothetical protein
MVGDSWKWLVRLNSRDTAFEEVSAGRAFDGTTLPISRLLARHNFRFARQLPNDE